MSTAEEGSFPGRFLYVYTSAGRDADSDCSGTGADFRFGRGFAPLEPFKSKITVLDGTQIPPHATEEHPDGRCSMLTGFRAAAPSAAQGISFDRLLANELSAGQSVYTGLQAPGGDIDLPISWNGAGLPNDGYLTGASALLEKLFPGAPTMSMPPPGMDPAADRLAKGELLLNDHLAAEVRRFERLAPAAEREKLELHLRSLAQIRATLETGGGGLVGLPSCDGVTRPSAADELDLMSSVIAHAFACGRTQVAVIRLGTEEPHHEWSHWQDGDDYRAKLRELDIELAQRFATLLGYLDSFPEGDGTLLDHTAVVWSSEVSGTYSGAEDLHGTVGMPVILAGGLGGKIKMGQRIMASGRTHAELLRAIGLQLGVPAAENFGDSALNTGVLDSILT